jgi:hypothetical protein
MSVAAWRTGNEATTRIVVGTRQSDAAVPHELLDERNHQWLGEIVFLGPLVLRKGL